MRPSRTLSVVFFTLYLLLAGAIPVLDAMLEHGVSAAVSERGPLDGSPGAPHGDSCALCVLIERAPATPGVASDLAALVVTSPITPGWPAWTASPRTAWTPSLGARAPPPSLA